MEVLQGFGKDPRQAPWHGRCLVSSAISENGDVSDDEVDAMTQYDSMASVLDDLTALCLHAATLKGEQQPAYRSPAAKRGGVEDLERRMSSMCVSPGAKCISEELEAELVETPSKRHCVKQWPQVYVAGEIVDLYDSWRLLTW